MSSINYNHLYYFYKVAHLGSISRASAELKVSQPTISEQLRKLEQDLQTPLFERVGRGLTLNAAGQQALRYAESIFSLGNEMVDAIHAPSRSVQRIDIAVDFAIPSAVVNRLLQPAWRMKDAIQIHVQKVDPVIGIGHVRCDLLLTGAPHATASSLARRSVLLAKCGTSFLAPAKSSPKRAKSLRESLRAVPLLTPSQSTAFGADTYQWLTTQDLVTNICGVFTDLELMVAAGISGTGCFPVPSLLEAEMLQPKTLSVIGRTAEIQHAWYAWTPGRQPAHPVVAAVLKAARER